MLNEQQKQFCYEYIKDFKVIQALVRAGYSQKTAAKNGYKFLQDPDIAFFLKELMDKVNEKRQLTADMVVEELRRLAFSDVSGYYKWHPKKKTYVLKPLNELTKEQTAAIAEYKPGEYYKLYNKDGSLDKLAKHFKLYSANETVLTNFMLMPPLKLNGKKVEFNIGKPAKSKEKQD